MTLIVNMAPSQQLYEVWGTSSSEHKDSRVLGFEDFQSVINLPTFRVIMLLGWSQHDPPKQQYISTRLFNPYPANVENRVSS